MIYDLGKEENSIYLSSVYLCREVSCKSGTQLNSNLEHKF